MNKKLSTILLLFPLLLSSCTDLPDDQNIDYQNDVVPLIEETNTGHKVLGSCNVIDAKSTCFDFIGSVFTEDRMKLSCTEGTFSFDSCPYSDLGGCMATEGTMSESIVWSYNYGGAPITAEEASYMAMACNAMDAGRWVTPTDLLKE